VAANSFSLAVGANSAPPNSLAGFNWATLRRETRREIKGRERKEKEEKGRKGREKTRPKPNILLRRCYVNGVCEQVCADGFVCGRRAYLSSGWNIMDGCLVVISIIDIIVSMSASHSPRIFAILRVFRLLRTLRPLRYKTVHACSVYLCTCILVLQLKSADAEKASKRILQTTTFRLPVFICGNCGFTTTYLRRGYNVADYLLIIDCHLSTMYGVSFLL